MTDRDPSECEVSEQSSDPAARSTEQEIDNAGLLVLKQEELDLDEETEELEAVAFVAVNEEKYEDFSSHQVHVDTSKIGSNDDSMEQDSNSDLITAVIRQTTSTSVDNGSESPEIVATGIKNKREGLSKQIRKTKPEVETVTVSLYTCNLCGHQTDNPDNYYSHHLEHHVTLDASSQCKECSLECKKASSAKVRTSIQTSEKQFDCKICFFKCKTAGSLKTHLMLHTGEKPYECKECSYKCRTAGDLKKHVMIHTGEKPFACKECTYKCRSSTDLKYHMRTHTGEKPFACEGCTYKCRSSSDLKTHVRTHTGEKAYQCDVCPYKSSTASTLRKHMILHTAEKPYGCEECPFKCRSAAVLKSHMRIHVGENAFHCGLCLYTCGSAESLKIHIMKNTVEKPYESNDCSSEKSVHTLLSDSISINNMSCAVGVAESPTINVTSNTTIDVPAKCVLINESFEIIKKKQIGRLDSDTLSRDDTSDRIASPGITRERGDTTLDVGAISEGQPVIASIYKSSVANKNQIDISAIRANLKEKLNTFRPLDVDETPFQLF